MKNSAIYLLLMCISLTGYSQTQFETLNYLYSISGNYTVSGMHNDRKTGDDPDYHTNHINSLTGDYPGLWGGDFSYDSRMNSSSRWAMVYEAVEQWNAGALVNLMWHPCPPDQSEPCNWEGGVKSSLTSSQWNDLITNGTYLNNVWKQRMDDIAVYLQYLEDEGVEVLWRPLHEMNQGNFWWGGRPGPNGTRKLFEQMYDYMTYTKGLTNLIWTWDMQDLGQGWNDYKPASNTWQVLAMDIYGSGHSTSWYNYVKSVADGKPIAIGECWDLPTSSQLATQDEYVFFMGWDQNVWQQYNTNSEIQNVIWASNVLVRDEMPGWTGSGGSTDNQSPTAPTNLSSTATTTTTVSLTWSASSDNVGVTGYDIYNNGSWIASSSSASVNVTGLSPGTAYSFTAKAFDAAGNYSAASNVVNVSTQSGGGSLTNLSLNKSVTTSSGAGGYAVDGNTAETSRWSAEGFPQWLEVDLGDVYSISQTQVVAYQDRAYQFVIESKTSAGGSYTTIVNRSSNTTPGTVSSPITDSFGPVNARYVRITVSGASGYSGSWAALVEFSVFGGTSSGDNQSPTVPSNLTSTASTTTTVSLSWGGSSDNVGVTGYDIYNNGSWVASSSGTSVNVTGLSPGTAYSFTAKAFDAAGNYSAASNVVNVSTQSGGGSLTNLSLNKSVTTSSGAGGYAVDGNTAETSRWSAEGFPQWLEVDLGDVYSISQTQVVAYQDRAYQFVIESKTSTGGSYTTIVNRSSNTTPGTVSSPITDSFGPVNARYVRISVSGASGYSGSWAALVEFRVFGSNSGGNQPIVIEAEDYDSMSGVNTYSTSDTGGGSHLGAISSGDWMLYEDVNIPSSGNYTVSYRISSEGGGGTIQLDQGSGGTVHGSVNLPSTGSWSTWATVDQSVTLTAGVQDIRILAVSSGWNINWFSITPAGGSRVDGAEIEISEEITKYPYPNPFKESIVFPLNELGRSNLEIRIFDLSGSLIRVFSKSDFTNGKVFWDGKSMTGELVPLGVYHYQIDNKNHRISGKIIKTE